MDCKEHGIKIVRGTDLDPNTPQAPGMSRAAITHARGNSSLPISSVATGRKANFRQALPAHTASRDYWIICPV